MSPRLTILMPLKGRDQFTFRFLWHAARMRLPYRFLIADGQVNEQVADRLEHSRGAFPELDIEYRRYPDDIDFRRYFAKMADAVSRVRTPFVMHADNDDLLGRHGIERALDFLEAAPDYACARSRIVNFTVHAGDAHGSISGRISHVYLHGDTMEVADPTAAERLRRAGLRSGLYYAVYRTEALARIWREVAEIGFSDLMLHENFCVLRALTFGKVHTDLHSVSYYSQSGTGISYQPLRDWAAHLLRSRFTTDASMAIERIAAASDGADRATIEEDVRTILEGHFRHFLRNNYGFSSEIKRALRQRWPRLATIGQTLRRSSRRGRARILTELRRAGASASDLDRVRSELAVVEETLTPAAIAEFAGAPVTHGIQ
jgi:glycosyltransferase domain-containing protein